jgi:hypothetical protein
VQIGVSTPLERCTVQAAAPGTGPRRWAYRPVQLAGGVLIAPGHRCAVRFSSQVNVSVFTPQEITPRWFTLT